MPMKPGKILVVLIAFGLAAWALFFLPAPIGVGCASAACPQYTYYNSWCPTKCCWGQTLTWEVSGCANPSWGCDWVWTTVYPKYCGSGCIVTYNRGKCSQPEGSWRKCTGPIYEADTASCCYVGDVPTDTPVPAPTDTPLPPPPPATSTPTPTRTPMPTYTPTPTVIPLSGSLAPQYSSLVLEGPRLGQPAQTLNGTINGGAPQYSVMLTVRRPDGLQNTYSLSPGASFTFGSAQGGTYFGTTQQGTWRAWFTVTDSGGSSATSNTAVWDVVFYPVHGVP